MSRPLLFALSLAAGTSAFAPPGPPGVVRCLGTRLDFGFNGLGGNGGDDDDDESNDKSDDTNITAGGLVQLIMAGMGAPFLGDYQGTDDDGKLMFSLEANNLVDEDGNSKQTQMPYFENGWVEEKEEVATSESKGGGFKFPWQK